MTTTKENPMITKEQLVEKYRGGPKGKAHSGTMVRLPQDITKGTLFAGLGFWTLPAGTYEVCDLYARKSYNKPDEIGIIIRPGIATSVRLDQIELA